MNWVCSTGPRKPPRFPEFIDELYVPEDEYDEMAIRRSYYTIDPYRTQRMRAPAPGNEDINDVFDIDPEQELNFH
jgi:NADPH-dependent curcumin reductase CurA